MADTTEVLNALHKKILLDDDLWAKPGEPGDKDSNRRMNSVLGLIVEARDAQ
jgi:hypothetical protein